MKDTQKQVDEWVQQYKMGYFKPLEILARLTEEVGELARELNHRFGPKKKKEAEDVKEIEDELGDIIFTLTCLANSLHLDMDRGVKKVIEKYNKRDKDRYADRKEEEMNRPSDFWLLLLFLAGHTTLICLNIRAVHPLSFLEMFTLLVVLWFIFDLKVLFGSEGRKTRQPRHS